MSFDEKYYPLSQSEYGIYYECQSGTTAYNLPLILPLEGFDTEKIVLCVKKFFELHPYLFTQFTLDMEGNVKKHIVKTEPDIKRFNINSLDEIKVTPFEMTDSYLYRVEIFTVAGKDHLFIDVHHTIFDGYSIALFLRSIFALYDGEELKAEEKDANRYALLEEKMRASDEYASAKNYYTERFSGLDCSPSIPEDIKEEKVRYKSYKKKLNVKRSDVSAFVKKTGCKTSAFFLSAFGYLVSKINMENEALFSTVHNGRNGENDYAVGMFVKTIPFYLSFEKGETVASLLQKATQEHRDNVKNDLYSFADITKDLSLSTDMIFAYQGDYMYKTDYHGKEIRLDQCPVSDGKGSLAIEIHRDTDGFYFWCEYRADLYTDFTAGQLMALYDRVLEEFMHKEYLSDISLLSEDETLILDKQNESETYIFDSEHTVLDYFEKHAKEAPDKEIVVFKDKRYTYADADKISAKIASKLCLLGVRTENVVSVLIDKSEYIVLASLGVLRSGAAYQPLDPSYPSERLEFMVKDSGAKVLILDRKYDNKISGFTGEKIYTDEIPSLPDAVCPNVKHKQSDLFIMLYTSGTTGLPKGVMLEHGSILNFSLMCNKLYDEDSSMKSSAYASYGFDADMMDIYPAITAGGCVFVIPEEMRLDLEQLGEYFNKEGITHSIITTQVGRQAVEELEFKTLKHLTVGGEKLVPLQPPKGYVLHNAYGPTEGTVFCSQQPVDKLYYRVPIGGHIEGYKFYILDENGKRLPRGVKGELCISGSGVARGYLNRDEENKKAFIKNPFESGAPFDRIYRTGDIVRFLEDGTVDFIGRNDGQVKIRGFRVELTEVEQIIRQYPGIKDATVKDFTDPAGVKFIAAYIVSDDKIDVDDLAAFIGKNKPPYMVPPFIVQLDKIPLNQNQKVNKKALPVPQPKKVETVPPETENEKKIFAILSEILGHDSFGVTTDIFEAGLTSVSSIRFTVRLSKAFSRPFKAGDLENMNTVRALAKAAEETVEEKVYQKLDKYPLTKTQEGIFIECLSSPGSTNYNIPILFKLSDEIDTQKLKCAVEQSLNAHPYVMSILSTDENGDVVALRKDYAPVVDVVTTGLPDSKTLVKPFTIIGENLYRAVIFDGADGKYLFFDIHHIVCDGTGMAVLISDITTAYEGKELEAETYSGYEMALEERDERQSERFEEAKKYYASLLAETDGEYLPKKSLKLSEKKLMAEEFDSLADVEKTKAFIKQNNLTLDAYFNFLFGYTLSLFNYKEDSLYTTVYNGRGDARTANAVSMLVKTLPVYIKFDLKQKFTDAVASLKKQTEASRKNSVYSFSEIASDNGIGADIIFAYQGDAFEFDSICGKKAEIQVLELDMPKAALSVQAEIKGGKFVFRFEYDASVYNADAIKDMCRAYETLIESAMSAKTVGDLKFLSEEDKRMYDVFNRTEEEKQDVTFNKLLEAQVLRVPDKTAVIAKDGQYSYRELNETANRIAHSLRERGVGLNDKVAVLMPRVKDAYAVRQGVMKAGAAFVPIDPVYPDERIEYILNDSSAKAIVSTKEILAAKKNCFKDTSASGYDVEELKNNANSINPDIDIPTDALCYIIYTSGSTGKPKGVMIMHKNLVNLCVDGKNIATQMYRDAGDVVSGSFASLSFDASVIEESVPLSHGYTAVIISEEEIENPILLSEKMISKGVNFIFATPSYVTNGLDCPQYVNALKGLNVLMMGAESLPPELIKKLRDLGVTAKIYNGYGPTETTVGCTFHPVTDNYVTIGKPVANTKIYMLNKRGDILPIGAIGDLTICGECVGAGYLGLKEKTAEKYITVNGLPAFRSGDLARFNNEGNVEFFGRLDNQVKLRGLRVELDEIEKAITSFDGVSRAIVLVKKSEAEGDYLCAYFTAAKEVDKDKLTSFISSRLTPYMVPKVMIQLEKMPLTPNGKIDKKQLPEPEITVSKRNIKKAKNEIEEKIMRIFSKALGNREIGADDDFFENGGTSLSASKVAMLAIAEGLPIAYKDVFEFSTAEEMAKHISSENGKTVSESKEEEAEANEEALKYNTIKYVDEIKKDRELGRVLLTGATGFLGSHILKELLGRQIHTVVLCRGKGELDAYERLTAMMAYYFDSPLEEEIEKYVTVIEGDVTNNDLSQLLRDQKIDTIINCAALVKHFATDDIIERINVGGLVNMIAVAKEKNARLIQISTLSVAGENVDNKFDETFRLHENALAVGQDISNKYVNSKYKAEQALYEAVEEGLDGKVIRVGNLMGRQSDGEFQINSVTNSFIRSLKAYRALGCFPVSACDTTVDFSPIDEISKAIVLLSMTDKKFTLFHCANSHEVQMGDVIQTMNRYGFNIDIVNNAVFSEKLSEMMKDDKRNMLVSSLLTYSTSDNHTHSFIKTDNTFTIKALYRLGYKWPITDEDYLLRVIEALDSLNYFDREDM